MKKYSLLAIVRKNLLIGIAICLCAAQTYAQKSTSLDYVIDNAWVFDGSGADSVKQSVGILGKNIVMIPASQQKKIKAKKVINAEGLYLSPGFIDPHTHYNKWLSGKTPEERINLPCLSQGVTTVFVGSDGFGTFKIEEELSTYAREGVGTNVALLVGFGSVRQEVLGNEDITPDATQLKHMEQLVADAMKQGAFGLSTGLYYAPQSYAKSGEVIALARVARQFGGIYDTHMRSESNGLMAAVQETLEIGRATGIPVTISHIKCLGPAAWGSSEEIVKEIEHAQAAGVQVTANQYPYEASSTSLKAMLMPRWAESGGNKEMVKRLENVDTLRRILIEVRKNLALRGGDNRILIAASKDPELKGKTLHEIAMLWNLQPEEAAIQILKKYPSISAVSFSMEEDDIVNFMKQPWVMTGSDGGGSHPRTYGSFVRVLREYVLDKQILSMKEAIFRASGQTAETFKIKNRGFIRDGYFADIVLFDPNTIRDNATFDAPDVPATGIKYVFVNGALALQDGTSTGVLSGEGLRHQQ